jgi:hypothetical protein
MQPGKYQQELEGGFRFGWIHGEIYPGKEVAVSGAKGSLI